jgi:WD40 repeat protein
VDIGDRTGSPVDIDSDPVHAVALGTRAGRSVIVTATKSRQIRVWDFETLEILGQFPAPKSHETRSLAIVENKGRAFVVSGCSMRGHVWDLETFKSIGTDPALCTGEAAPVAIGRIQTDPVVVIGTPFPEVRELKSLNLLTVAVEVYSRYAALAVSQRGGRSVVVSAGFGISIWDLLTGVPVERNIRSIREVRSIAVASRHGRFVVIAGCYRSLQLFDIESFESLGSVPHIDWVSALAVGERHGKRVIVTACESSVVYVWDMDTLAPVLSIDAGSTVLSLLVDGDVILAACTNGMARLRFS